MKNYHTETLCVQCRQSVRNKGYARAAILQAENILCYKK